MDNRKFLNVIVKDAQFHLRKHLEDCREYNVRLGIGYGKKTWKKIMLNFDLFITIARSRNLEVSVTDDGTRHIFYRLIQKEIWQ